MSDRNPSKLAQEVQAEPWAAPMVRTEKFDEYCYFRQVCWQYYIEQTMGE